MSKKRHAAEFVFPGHPDKLCDAVADALVEAAAHRERRALAAIEVAVFRDTVLVTGRIACAGAKRIGVEDLVRGVYASAGYGGDWRPSPEKLRVRTELVLDELTPEEAGLRDYADDQTICTGYAVDRPATNYLPPEHWLANRLGQAFAACRGAWPELGLGPDGKLLAVLGEEDGKFRLDTFNLCVQQREAGKDIELFRMVRTVLERQLAACAAELGDLSPALPERLCVNGMGAFEMGGPEADNGLSGKKLAVDAYGPRVPIGGGALSGKDFFKVDRAGALLARRLAKAAVLTGAAAECLVRLAILPGDAAFGIVSLQDGDGAELDRARWAALLDLGLRGAGEAYAGTGALVDVARHGHFTAAAHPWERVRLQ